MMRKALYALAGLLSFLGAALGAPTSTIDAAWYPQGSVAFNIAGSGTTGSAVANIPAVANRTIYVCVIYFSSGGFTAASMVTPTATGLIGGGTLNLAAYNHPSTGQGSGGAVFAPACLQAAGRNQAVAITLPGGGAGTSPLANTLVTGYYL